MVTGTAQALNLSTSQPLNFSTPQLLNNSTSQPSLSTAYPLQSTANSPGFWGKQGSHCGKPYQDWLSGQKGLGIKENQKNLVGKWEKVLFCVN